MFKRSTKESVAAVEEAVISTFKKEIPSVHFSDKSEKDYEEWMGKHDNLFHNLLKFPPKMFAGCSLIDFGAGTGENTIQFANWGASCTLVDASDKSCGIAAEVFKQYAEKPDDHTIICESIFDFENGEQYDIAFSNGVIHHTADKVGAFAKIASFVKPGGYVILGIGNKAGGFQNMLQRIIIYKFAKTDDEIVELAEMLFKEDIDRSQRFSNRSRNSMIYDRFVVPKQDEPSVSEVLQWFTDNDLQYYSSYPPIQWPMLGDSDLNPPTFEVQNFIDIGALTEALWVVNKDDDREEVPRLLGSIPEFAGSQFALADYVNDIEPDTEVDLDELQDLVAAYQNAMGSLDFLSHLKKIHEELFGEVKSVVESMKLGDLETLCAQIAGAKRLFRGANGLRHMYFISHKPHRA